VIAIDCILSVLSDKLYEVCMMSGYKTLGLGPRVSKERCSRKTIPRPLASIPPTRYFRGQTMGVRRGEKPAGGSGELVKIHLSGFDELRPTAPPA
jgi:hypothetical protein